MKSAFPYEDIIDLPHPDPDPVKHPRMSAKERAAQFAPFRALTGFDEAVEETASDAVARRENEITRETFTEDP